MLIGKEELGLEQIGKNIYLEGKKREENSDLRKK